MLIYRIEHTETSLGPYTRDQQDHCANCEKIGKTIGDRHNANEKRWPGPTLEERVTIFRYIHHTNIRFGFKTQQEIFQWFDLRDIDTFIAYQCSFALVERHVENSKMFEVAKEQIVFDIQKSYIRTAFPITDKTRKHYYA